MALSGSRDFNLTLSEVLEEVGLICNLGKNEYQSTDYSKRVRRKANLLLQSWLNEHVFLHTKSDDLQLLTADTLSYNLDADIDQIDNVFFRKNGTDAILEKLTKEEYTALSDKDQSGDPTRYYIDYQLAQPVIKLWPIYEYTTTVVTGTDSNKYLCILDHEASTDDTPITGSNYADYWDSTSETANATWTDETNYYSGILRFTKIYKLQDLDANTNAENIDLKSKNLLAFIYALAYEVSLLYPTVSNEKRHEIRDKAKELKTQMKDSDNESDDLIIIPKTR